MNRVSTKPGEDSAALLSRGVDCPCSRKKPRSHRQPAFGRKRKEAYAPPSHESLGRPEITTSHEVWPRAGLTPLLFLARPVGPLVWRLEGEPSALAFCVTGMMRIFGRR